MSHPDLPVRLRTVAVVVLAVLAAAVVAAMLRPGSPLGPQRADAAASQTLRLSAASNGQLRFATTTLRARHGAVTILMSNPSSSGLPHGIAVTGRGLDRRGAIVSPGHQSRLTVSLAAGRYVFYCPFDGHRKAGMRGVLVVS
jgi:uncharacterized cupredoxin-like copper-binding protein